MGADMQQLALSVTVSVPLPGRFWSWGRSRPRSPASLRRLCGGSLTLRVGGLLKPRRLPWQYFKSAACQ